jgi:hypothetical protein
MENNLRSIRVSNAVRSKACQGHVVAAILRDVMPIVVRQIYLLGWEILNKFESCRDAIIED